MSNNVVYGEEINTESISNAANAGVSNEASDELKELVAQKPISALIYLCNEYEVKAMPSMDSDTVATLESGHTVFIQDVAMDLADNIWFLVMFYSNQEEKYGYVEWEYLAYSDERFIDWEQKYLYEAVEELDEDVQSDSVYAAAGILTRDILQFPMSYQAALLRLKQAHPNWTFVRQNTGLDWAYVIMNELGIKSLVPSSSSPLWISAGYGSGWSYASQAILEYYIDPRNALNETSIFQFEQLTYNESYHTEEAVQRILANTFMAGIVPNEGITYAKAIWGSGQMLGVSPFHLASRLHQEQGNGTSPLISGTYPGYEGYYNYFNVSASGSTTTAIITSGLKYAKNNGWDSRVKSILYGAEVVSRNYILKGQDTLYLQKFCVVSDYYSLFSHQYMQNIIAPTSEARTMRNAYANVDALDNRFVFKIPVYENMPSVACPLPGEFPGELEVVYGNMAEIQPMVANLYRYILQREPSEGELNYWADELMHHRRSGLEVVSEFALGEELTNRDLTNEQYVKVLFGALLGRMTAEGDAGIAYWTNMLDNGVSRLYVLKAIGESQEFVDICNRCIIEVGELAVTDYRDYNPNITMYVYRCYKYALGRVPSVGEINYWAGEMLAKRVTAYTMASQFVFSPEFVNKNLDDDSYLRTLYMMFMDREADWNGLLYWKELIATVGMTREDLFDAFIHSQEFTDILATFGL